MSTQRYSIGAKFFTRVLDYDPDIASLLMPFLLLTRSECSAVEVLHSSILKMELNSWELLRRQVIYLRDKGIFDLALEAASFALQINPMSYHSWMELADLYIMKKDYESCFIVLNSCPIIPVSYSSLYNSNYVHEGNFFQNFEKHLIVTKSPARKHFSINDDAHIPTTIYDLQQSSDPILYFIGHPISERDSCDISLFRLQGNYLRGTPSVVYSKLCKIVSEIGWDRLLQIRGNVFVMEDEYRGLKKKHEPLNKNLIGKPWYASIEFTVDMFEKKRLCERWLDNLFIVLYEDLRVYTVYKAELEQSKNEHKTYARTPLEWEMLGDLCLRLHKPNEAKECWQNYVENRYSYKVLVSFSYL